LQIRRGSGPPNAGRRALSVRARSTVFGGGRIFKAGPLRGPDFSHEFINFKMWAHRAPARLCPARVLPGGSFRLLFGRETMHSGCIVTNNCAIRHRVASLYTKRSSFHLVDRNYVSSNLCLCSISTVSNRAYIQSRNIIVS